MNLSFHYASEPFLPTIEDVKLAQETSRKIAAHMQPKEVMNLRIWDQQGSAADIQLPASIVRLLLDMLEQVANGNAISLLPLQAELTTQQAADILNVSRPFLVKLLDEGEIPSRKVGSHRRVKARDILAYKQDIYTKRNQVLDNLTSEAQELNWGYE
ncbi:MAG: helix-turn-helix domain-containing protein [Bacteroidia bacterium]|nr:helix-turn-helix domain-containing protein [Bacteroidia bacterium]